MKTIQDIIHDENVQHKKRYSWDIELPDFSEFKEGDSVWAYSSWMKRWFYGIIFKIEDYTCGVFAMGYTGNDNRLWTNCLSKKPPGAK